MNEKHARRRLRMQQARSFWATDSSLSLVLALLVGNIFIMPAAHFVTWGRLGARVTLSLTLISGLVATVRDKRLVSAAITLVLAGFIVGWEDIARPNLYFHLTNDVTAFLVVALLVGLIFHQVFRTGPITMRRIEGSIALYILLGILWMIAYGILELLAPGSFQIGPVHGGADLPDLGYFSFTTLTTLGLGDVLPLSPPARSLVMLEALVGQLFPVILIARLVSLEIEHRRSERN